MSRANETIENEQAKIVERELIRMTRNVQPAFFHELNFLLDKYICPRLGEDKTFELQKQIFDLFDKQSIQPDGRIKAIYDLLWSIPKEYDPSDPQMNAAELSIV